MIVCQKSTELVIATYKLTDKFPKEEMYGITSQIRRSAVSIPSNIAEGKLRESSKEFRRFLLIAFGSGGELETQIYLAKQLGFADMGEYNKVEALLEEVMKMLNKLVSLNSKT